MKVVLALLFCAVTALSHPLIPDGDEEPLWQKSGHFEGDIVLNPAQKVSIARNGLLSTETRWPNRTIVYRFHESVSESVRGVVRTALQQYNTRTCVTVREATAADKDLVVVTSDDSGCWSYVGRQGGEQELNLQNSTAGTCLSTGTIVHEFLHAAGFFHQQSASERDDYVTIQWENIRSGVESNFVKYTPDTITEFGVEYDYSSVMHYSATAFSKNGLPTIVTKDPEAVIGQRLGFSEADILKLERMYGCK